MKNIRYILLAFVFGFAGTAFSQSVPQPPVPTPGDQGSAALQGYSKNHQESVNSSSLDLNILTSDLAVPGRQLSLVVQKNYSSSPTERLKDFPQDNVVGEGWYLSINGMENIYVTSNRGGYYHDVFIRLAGNTVNEYKPDIVSSEKITYRRADLKWDTETLRQGEFVDTTKNYFEYDRLHNRFIYRTSDGINYIYGWHMGDVVKLSEIIDVFGNMIVLNYKSDGHLERITDSLQRYYVFEYGESGAHLRSILAWESGGISYEHSRYVYSGDKLVTYSDGEDRLTRYIYEDGSSRIIRIVYPTGGDSGYEYAELEQKMVSDITTSQGTISDTDWDELLKQGAFQRHNVQTDTRHLGKFVVKRRIRTRMEDGANEETVYTKFFSYRYVAENRFEGAVAWGEDGCPDSGPCISGYGSLKAKEIWHDLQLTENRTEIVDQAGKKTEYWFDSSGSLIRVKNPKYFDGQGNGYYEEIVNNYVLSGSSETVTFNTDLSQERWYKDCWLSSKQLLKHPDRIEYDCDLTIAGCCKIWKETETVHVSQTKTRSLFEYSLSPVSETNNIVINNVPYVVGGVSRKYDWNGNVSFESNIVTGHINYTRTDFNPDGEFVINRAVARWETNLTGGVKREIRDEFVYNAVGSLLRIDKRLGDEMKTVSRYRYDPNYLGNVDQIEDALGNITKYEYSADTRYGYPSAVVKYLDGKEVRNRFGYDFYSGNVLWSEDFLGNRSEFRYDKVNRLTFVRNPDGGTREFDYNSGLQRSETVIRDASGKILQKQYSFFGDLGDPLTQIVEDGQDPSVNNKVQYVYDGRGLVTNIINDPENARIITRQFYDGPGRLREIRFADGGRKILSFYWDTAKKERIEEETVWPTDDPADSRTTRRMFNFQGDLIRIEYPPVTIDGSVTILKTKYEYDDLHNTVLIRDAAGKEKKLFYDDFGRMVRTVFPDGSVTVNEYDLIGNLVAKIDPNGNRAEMVYNSQYEVVAVKDPLGNETHTAYDANGNKTNEVDARGKKISYRYDVKNRLIAVIDENGNLTRYTYDFLDNCVEEIDRLGNRSRSYFDGLSRLVRTLDPIGAESVISYDNLNRKVWVSDARGVKTFFFYDSMGRPVRSEDAGGNVSRFFYDYLGNQVRTEDAEGRWAENRYDKLNRLVRVINSAGEQFFEYDAMGNRIKGIDPEGKTTRWAYDSQNRITSVIDASGRASLYSYDRLGNLLSVMDKADNFRRYEYDAVGRKIKEIEPDGNAKQYFYNETGDLVKSIDEDGRVMGMDYNNRGEMTNLESADSVVRYRYDAEGRLLGVYDSTGHEEYIYDPDGRVVERKVDYSGLGTNASLQAGYRFLQRYDLNGNMTNLGLPSGAKVRYVYDDLNRLEKVYSFGVKAAEYEYNRAGQVKNVNYANGAENRYFYDDSARLTGLEIYGKRKEVGETIDGTLLAEYYTYDKANNRIEKRNFANEYARYRYDALDQLTGVDYKYSGAEQWDEEYSYDAMGNRTRMKYKFGGIEYDYDMRTSRLKEYRVNQNGIARYGYDNRGNTILKRNLTGNEVNDEFHYDFDTWNRLVKIRHNNLKTDNGEQTEIDYRYNSAGKRIAVKEPESGTNKGGMSFYIYSGNEVVAELDKDGNIKTEFVFGLEKTFRAEYLISVKPDKYTSETKVKLTWFHSDTVGSAQILTDDQGFLVQEYQYGPFGSLIYSRGADGSRYLFAGKDYDESTGLSYFGARYYDPLTGRFISADPVISAFSPVTHNRYVYTANNPYRYIDPSGRSFLGLSLSIGFGKNGLSFSVGLNIQLGPFYIGVGLTVDGKGNITPGLNAGIGLAGFGVGVSWNMSGDLAKSGDDSVSFSLGYGEKGGKQRAIGLNADIYRGGWDVGLSAGIYGANVGGSIVFDKGGVAGFRANIGYGYKKEGDPRSASIGVGISVIRGQFAWNASLNAQYTFNIIPPRIPIKDPKFTEYLKKLIQNAKGVSQDIKDKINIDDIMNLKYESESWKLLNGIIRHAWNNPIPSWSEANISGSDWKPYKGLLAIYHQDFNLFEPSTWAEELKYVNNKTGQEVVFRLTSNGYQPITLGEFQGTYNFSTLPQNPTISQIFQYINYHNFFDVDPFTTLGVGD